MRNRTAAERSWQRFTEGAVPDDVRPDVLRSWRRSGHVPLSIDSAPVTPSSTDAVERWEDSPAGRAYTAVADELRAVAQEGDFVAAATDADGTIVWTAGGRTMRRRAESVAFVPGGRWGEDAVGTNALGMALCEGRPSVVWSAEHYAPIVHDWVCYSAPFHDPLTGAVAGVIDLSTTWRRANPLALTTVTALARLYDQALAATGTAVRGGRSGGAGASGGLLAPGRPDGAGPWPGPVPGQRREVASGLGFAEVAVLAAAFDVPLRLRLLGTAEVALGHTPLLLPPRQVELLAVLSLAPTGLTLDALHDRLHGDRPVRPSTTKAEVSHLRRVLGRRLASRPYRLLGPVVADHVDVLGAVASERLHRALDLYRGPLLPASEAPALVEHRYLVDAAVRNAVLGGGTVDDLARLAERMPDDAYLHELVVDRLPRSDPRHALAQAHLDSLLR